MNTESTAQSRADDVRRQSRREHIWAWASLVSLVIAWDVSSRLDERVAAPRVRLAHAGEPADSLGARIESATP